MARRKPNARDTAVVPRSPDRGVVAKRLHDIMGDELREILEHDPDPHSQQLLQLLDNPTRRDQTVGYALQAVGLTNDDLAEKYCRAKGIESKVIIAKHIPHILDDMAKDARSHDYTCHQCDGTGRIRKNPCPTCKGRGKVREKGDAESRKGLLEAAGLTGKRGPLVAQQFNLDATKYQSLEDVVNVAAKAIEAEAVDASPSEDNAHQPRPEGNEPSVEANS